MRTRKRSNSMGGEGSCWAMAENCSWKFAEKTIAKKVKEEGNITRTSKKTRQNVEEI